MIGSGDVVRRLTVVHRDSWREWAAGVGSQLAGGMDLLLLSVGVAPVFLLALATSARALAQPATPAGLLLIVVGVALVALSGTEAFRHLAGARVRVRRLSVLLLLTSMAPALGTLALLLGIHATSVLYATGAATAASVSAASEPAAMVSAASASAATVSIASTLARDGATFVLGACLGIGGLLAWFVLQSRASLQAIREVDDILAGRAHSPVSARTRGIIPLVKGWHA